MPLLALIAGNEAYAESAVVAPVGDLAFWATWDGVKLHPYFGEFPYPLIYFPDSGISLMEIRLTMIEVLSTGSAEAEEKMPLSVERGILHRAAYLGLRRR